MIRMIKIELEKLFCSRRFYLSMAGVILGIPLTSLSMLQYSTHETICSMFHTCSGEAFSLLVFLLCVVGGGISFCMEQKSQSIRYITLRGNARDYAIGKIVSAFLGGYLISLIGLVLGEFLLVIPLYIQQGNWNCLTSCVEQIGLDILTDVVYSFRYGILSVVAVLVSVFIPDVFITMVAPIVIYYVYLNITGWFACPSFLDITQMTSAVYYVDDYIPGQFWNDLEKAVCFSLTVVYIMSCAIIKKMKWRVEHG